MKKATLAIIFTVLASNAVLATAHAEGPEGHHPLLPRHHIVKHPVHHVYHHPHHAPVRHEPIRHD